MCDQATTALANKQEACKTYVEQTKLLVTLSSAFVVAPAGVLALDSTMLRVVRACVCHIVAAELCFAASVLAGYIVLGTVAGSQFSGSYDVYRPGTMIMSWAQILLYLSGLGLFIYVVTAMFGGTAA